MLTRVPRRFDSISKAGKRAEDGIRKRGGGGGGELSKWKAKEREGKGRGVREKGLRGESGYVRGREIRNRGKEGASINPSHHPIHPFPYRKEGGGEEEASTGVERGKREGSKEGKIFATGRPRKEVKSER